jgi:hypothetical protein
MGKKQGKGTYYYLNGNIFKGDWANDQINGFGVVDGQKAFYEGQWRNGLAHGKGTSKFDDASKYEG